MIHGFATRASAARLIDRFMAFPTWAKVVAIAAAAALVIGVVSIPVAAVAVDRHNRQQSLEIAAQEAAAEAEAAAAAADALAQAKDDAAGLNTDYAGLTASLGAAVHPDAAAAFDAARVDLALAIADGDLDEVSAAAAAVADALESLVASAEDQAAALISASPLAGDARDALTKAVADLAAADDVVAAFGRVKDAADAVVAAQKAGEAAAEAAAKEQAAAEAGSGAGAGTESWTGGGSSGGGTPTGGGGGVAPPQEDPGITGMYPGGRGSCGEDPTGQVVWLAFGWEAREGNTVDISYAYTDGHYQATDNFTLLASGRGSTGSVSIPVTCPVGVGPTPYVTVKAVASNSLGSAAAYYWGL